MKRKKKRKKILRRKKGLKRKSTKAKKRASIVFAKPSRRKHSRAIGAPVAYTKDVGMEIQKLISLGKEKGYLTYDEINDALPENIVTSEQIDNISLVNDHLEH